MSHNRIAGAYPLVLAALCYCVLSPVQASAFQILEQPEKAEPGQHQHHMGSHHMNVPMGEETCAPKYTYSDGPQGPSHWEGVCTTGKMQAPIDIQNAQKLPINNLKFGYEAADLDVINNCNQYRILVRFPDNNWLKIGKKPYFLSELHFRDPAENAVNGERSRMSVQLVHLSPESTFVIIEVPIVAGKENPAFKSILAHLPAPGKEKKVQGTRINPTDFLPADRSFYRFPGSLTTPPFCNEGVTWYVMKNPIEFSEAQIAEYEKLYHNSARPLQPGNGRPIAESE